MPMAWLSGCWWYNLNNKRIKWESTMIEHAAIADVYVTAYIFWGHWENSFERAFDWAHFITLQCCQVGFAMAYFCSQRFSSFFIILINMYDKTFLWNTVQFVTVAMVCIGYGWSFRPILPVFFNTRKSLQIWFLPQTCLLCCFRKKKWNLVIKLSLYAVTSNCLIFRLLSGRGALTTKDTLSRMLSLET